MAAQAAGSLPRSKDFSAVAMPLKQAGSTPPHELAQMIAMALAMNEVTGTSSSKGRPSGGVGRFNCHPWAFITWRGATSNM
jgi:hypothetical protein